MCAICACSDHDCSAVPVIPTLLPLICLLLIFFFLSYQQTFQLFLIKPSCALIWQLGNLWSLLLDSSIFMLLRALCHISWSQCSCRMWGSESFPSESLEKHSAFQVYSVFLIKEVTVTNSAGSGLSCIPSATVPVRQMSIRLLVSNFLRKESMFLNGKVLCFPRYLFL